MLAVKSLKNQQNRSNLVAKVQKACGMTPLNKLMDRVQAFDYYFDAMLVFKLYVF